VEQPDLVDARVVDVRDGECEDVRGGDDVPVLPPLVAPAREQAAPDAVGVVQRAPRPADRVPVEATVRAAEGDGRGDLALRHGRGGRGRSAGWHAGSLVPGRAAAGYPLSADAAQHSREGPLLFT